MSRTKTRTSPITFFICSTASGTRFINAHAVYYHQAGRSAETNRWINGAWGCASLARRSPLPLMNTSPHRGPAARQGWRAESGMDGGTRPLAGRLRAAAAARRRLATITWNATRACAGRRAKWRFRPSRARFRGGTVPGSVFELVDESVFREADGEEGDEFRQRCGIFCVFAATLPVDMDRTPFKVGPPPHPAWCADFFSEAGRILRRWLPIGAISARHGGSSRHPDYPAQRRAQPTCTAFPGPQSTRSSWVPLPRIVHTDEMGRIKSPISVAAYAGRDQQRDQPFRHRQFNVGRSCHTQMPRKASARSFYRASATRSWSISWMAICRGRWWWAAFTTANRGNAAFPGRESSRQSSPVRHPHAGATRWNRHKRACLRGDTPGQLRCPSGKHRYGETKAKSGPLVRSRVSTGNAAPRGQGRRSCAPGAMQAMRAARGDSGDDIRRGGPRPINWNTRKGVQLMTERSRPVGRVGQLRRRTRGEGRCALSSLPGA